MVTFIEIVILSVLVLLVVMGFGFIISGIAKNEGCIPPQANGIIVPQFLLTGTFFPVDAIPVWLQSISYALPLRY